MSTVHRVAKNTGADKKDFRFLKSSSHEDEKGGKGERDEGKSIKSKKKEVKGWGEGGKRGREKEKFFPFIGTFFVTLNAQLLIRQR